MYANIEWRVGTEVPSRVFRTVLQDFKKSIGIFLLFQGLITSRKCLLVAIAMFFFFLVQKAANFNENLTLCKRQ